MAHMTPRAKKICSAILLLVDAADEHRQARKSGNLSGAVAAARRVDAATHKAASILGGDVCQKIIQAVSPKKSVTANL